jgi:hypothetical protein
MADRPSQGKPITGVIGDAQVSLNVPAWATDASVKGLTQQITKLNSKIGWQTQKGMKDTLTKAFSKALKDNKALFENKPTKETKQPKQQTTTAKSNNNNNKSNQEVLNNWVNNLNKSSSETSNALKTFTDSLTKAGGMFGGSSLGGGSGNLGKLAGGLRAMGPLGMGLSVAFTALTGVVKAIGWAIKQAVKLVSGAFLFAVRETIKVFNVFNDSLRDGISGIIGEFNGGVANFAKAAGEMGMSIEQVTEALRRNSEEITVLGLDRYKELFKNTKFASDGLYDMGYTTEEMTEIIGKEMSIRSMLGIRLDQSGRDLALNINETAANLRKVSFASGVTADKLYEFSKLEEDSIALLSARVRGSGDDAINAIQTNIRNFAIQLNGLVPQTARLIQKPLIDAITTGAIGLDEQFTELVTVFPGLVSTFDRARSVLLSDTVATSDQITDILRGMTEISDEEFERAKQMALLTRNQNAIQMVQFATELRARQRILDRIGMTDEETIGNQVGVFTSQLSVFFDQLKAPFTASVASFILGLFGDRETIKDLNINDQLDMATVAAFKRFGDAVDTVIGWFTFDESRLPSTPLGEQIARLAELFFLPEGDIDGLNGRTIDEARAEAIEKFADGFSGVASELGLSIQKKIQDFVAEMLELEDPNNLGLTGVFERAMTKMVDILIITINSQFPEVFADQAAAAKMRMSASTVDGTSGDLSSAMEVARDRTWTNWILSAPGEELADSLFANFDKAFDEAMTGKLGKFQDLSFTEEDFTGNYGMGGTNRTISDAEAKKLLYDAIMSGDESRIYRQVSRMGLDATGSELAEFAQAYQNQLANLTVLFNDDAEIAQKALLGDSGAMEDWFAENKDQGGRLITYLDSLQYGDSIALADRILEVTDNNTLRVTVMNPEDLTTRFADIVAMGDTFDIQKRVNEQFGVITGLIRGAYNDSDSTFARIFQRGDMGADALEGIYGFRQQNQDRFNNSERLFAQKFMRDIIDPNSDLYKQLDINNDGQLTDNELNNIENRTKLEQYFERNNMQLEATTTELITLINLLRNHPALSEG